MRAIRVSRSASSTGNPTIRLEDVAIPFPLEGQLLVKIHASVIQPSDVLNALGSFSRTTFPRILGRDFAGIIAAGRRTGDRVYGTSGSIYSFAQDGFHAEYALVEERAVAHMPSNISFKQAAVVGVPFTTAALALKRTASHKSERVLVLGASGAVGSVLVNLARGKGCVVYTATRKDGSDLNTTSDPQLGALHELTSGKGVDVVIDTTGQPDLIRAAMSRLAHRGRLDMISGKEGNEVTVDVRNFYREEKSLVGCNSVKCSVEEMAEELERITNMVESGELKLPSVKIWTEVNLEDGVQTYQLASERKRKFVLVIE